ncbi:MAG TPA: tetratricopeptide repeat protein, partial [Chloroflexota bacterium]|nr:tetratricopeptide repeat protein [Chloroflexota bacterium]
RKGQVHRIAVDSLPIEATKDLIDAVDAESSSRMEEIYDLAQGNPLFTLELAREARDTQPLVLSESLIDVVKLRMGNLEAEARILLDTGSVLGQRWTVPQAVETLNQFGAPQSQYSVLAVLEHLTDTSLLAVYDDGFGFAHPIYGSVVYELMSSERRRMLHAAAGRGLEWMRPDDVEELARHFQRSHNDESAAFYLEAAGDRTAALYANEAALERYQSALQRLTRQDGEIRARLDEKVGLVLLTVGRLDKAESSLEAAAAWRQETRDLPGLARVSATLGRVYRAQGRSREAISRLEEIAKVLAPDDGEALADVQSVLARLLSTVGRYDDSIAAAEKSLELARAVGNAQIVANSAVARATAMLFAGHLEEGKPALVEAIDLAHASGDLNLLQVALANLAEVDGMEGRYAESLDHHAEALRIVRQMGDPNREAFGESAVGTTLMNLGRWQDARRHLEAAVQIAEGLESTWYSAYPFIHLARLEVYSGRQVEAERLLNHAAALTESGQDSQAAIFAQMALAESDLAAARFEAALGRLNPVVEDEGRAGSDFSSILVLQSLALNGLGRHDEAITFAQRALSRAQQEGALTDQREAFIALGAATIDSGNALAAGQVLAQALQMSTDMGDLFAQARAHRQLAKVEMTSDSAKAGHHEMLANNLFRRIGARASLVESDTVAQRGSI